MKWYYQFTPHDTHDWDAVQPMLLVDEVWQGRPRKLLMHGDRNGMFYVLDRTNGEVLLTANLSTKVTWLKGFTKDGKPIVDPGLDCDQRRHRGVPRRRRRRQFPGDVVQPDRPSCSTRASATAAASTRRTKIRWVLKGNQLVWPRHALR